MPVPHTSFWERFAHTDTTDPMRPKPAPIVIHHVPKRFRPSVPYDLMVEGYEQICYSIVAQRLLDFVPATEPGWDSRPRHGEEVPVTTGQIPPDASA